MKYNRVQIGFEVTGLDYAEAAIEKSQEQAAI
jgi:hypothetical protein